MNAAVRNRLRAALKQARAARRARARHTARNEERQITQAWAFLDAWRTHFPSSYPKNAPKRTRPRGLDANRLLKSRRIALAWLARRLS